MKDFVLEIIIYIGLITSTISAMDFFVSQSFKRRLKDYAESLWIWLDYKKGIDFFKIPRKSENHLLLSVSLTTIVLYFSSIIASPESGAQLTFIYFIAIITNILAYYTIKPLRSYYKINVSYVLDTEHLSIAATRAIGYSLNPTFIIPFFALKIFNLEVIILLFAYPIIILANMWLWLLAYASIITFLKLMIFLSSAIVYKIASYPKGPMIFISGFLSSIAAILKIYTSI
ncbi:hypothetical protein K1F50_06920 [Muricauda oceani]|uniref:Uncharacterized protein n=1 Tax=Flagellimonas oceani TaxID=2698672 RepID=A0A6G7J6N2_9FLAO|nr:hypothetical protein [Allomuricauda oceani]MBW8242529.1 hypothetical protein [Allomuricauda oceani]QII46289.1 hypothetical protein GVT53_16905 [Allomuricauda oceani]